MTPQEKAKNLVDQLYFVLSNNGKIDDGINSCQKRWNDAKKCMSKVVLELIEVSQDDKHFKHTEFSQTHMKYKSYWILVKEEIEKL